MNLRLETSSIKHSDYYLVKISGDWTCGGKKIQSMEFKSIRLCIRYFERICKLPIWKPYDIRDVNSDNTWLDIYP